MAQMTRADLAKYCDRATPSGERPGPTTAAPDGLFPCRTITSRLSHIGARSPVSFSAAKIVATSTPQTTPSHITTHVGLLLRQQAGGQPLAGELGSDGGTFVIRLPKCLSLTKECLWLC